MNKQLIVVAGPTAVGKTSLSLRLAMHFGTEIISADSRQIYREMSIGTAKPVPEEMQGIRHHFIDTHSIFNGDVFNASIFEQESLAILKRLFQQHDVVIVTGGTGLYIQALCEGFDKDIPPANDAVRNELIDLHNNQGIKALQDKLQQLDPTFHEQVDRNNPQRLMRAIEVCLTSGKPYSEIRKGKKAERSFKIIKIGLERERQELTDRIHERVDKMIIAGLENEVKSLLSFADTNAMKTVGYQEMKEYFLGRFSLEEAIEKIKINTRQYAKRQLTWFKRDRAFTWFHPDHELEIVNYIAKK